LDIIKCTKLDDEGFGLTIFLNTEPNLSVLSERLLWLKDHLENRKILIHLFGGEPMVPQFGNHVLPDNLGTIFLMLHAIFKDKLTIEVYSDLIVPYKKFKEIVDSVTPFKACFEWSFTPEFYSQTSMKDFVAFMKNMEYIQERDLLGITSLIVSEANKSFDLHIHKTLTKKFPKASIYLTPKQGEESFFYNSNIGSLEKNKASHAISRDLDIAQAISYHELIVHGYNKFKGFYCDTKNHAVMDMSGKLYACLSAFSNRDVLFSEGSKLEFSYRLGYTKCAYASCDYDDNMSVVQ